MRTSLIQEMPPLSAADDDDDGGAAGELMAAATRPMSPPMGEECSLAEPLLRAECGAGDSGCAEDLLALTGVSCEELRWALLGVPRPQLRRGVDEGTTAEECLGRAKGGGRPVPSPLC